MCPKGLFLGLVSELQPIKASDLLLNTSNLKHSLGNGFYPDKRNPFGSKPKEMRRPGLSKYCSQWMCGVPGSLPAPLCSSLLPCTFLATKLANGRMSTFLQPVCTTGLMPHFCVAPCSCNHSSAVLLLWGFLAFLLHLRLYLGRGALNRTSGPLNLQFP